MPSPPPDAPRPLPRSALASNPTLADGVPPADEAAARAQLDALITEVALQLSLNPAGVAAAAALAHRFYAANSMASADRVAVAGGAVFLAGKLEETPRTLDAVLAALKSVGLPPRPGGDPPLADQADAILTAERALLYSSGFKLGLDHPFRHLLPLLAARAPIGKKATAGEASPSGDAAPPPRHTLQQQAWNMAVESVPTRLDVSVPAAAVSAGAFALALRIFGAEPRAADKDAANADADADADAAVPWWEDAGVAPGELAGVVDVLLKQYEDAAPAGGGDGGDAKRKAPVEPSPVAAGKRVKGGG